MSRRRGRRMGAVSPEETRRIKTAAIKHQAAHDVRRDIDAMVNADDCVQELGFLMTAAFDLHVMHSQNVSDQYIEEMVQDAEDDFVFRCIRRDRGRRSR